MPWQRYVEDIALEIDPSTGNPWYRTIILVITRQEGKTTLVIDNGILAALSRTSEMCVYTAQNRIKALDRLDVNWYEPLRKHAPALLQPRRDKSKPGWVGQSGSEHIRFITDSRIMIDAVKDDSGHGGTVGRAFIDEAFKHADATIEQNLRPMMLTRADAQSWITSAAGIKGKSVYLWDKVQLGRAIVEARDPNSRIAYFEWSDDDGDRADPEVWKRCLPALGHTVTLETVYAEFEAFANDPDEFDRAYLGRWPGARLKDPEIPVEAWRQCVLPPNAVEPIDLEAAPPVYVVDTSPDREWTSVSITGQASDPLGTICSRLAGYEQGTTWAPSFLDELRGKFGGDTVYIAGDGAAASLAPDLEALGFEVLLFNSGDICNACGAHYDAVLKGLFRTTEDKDLNGALAAAVKRNVGDRWRWWRGRSLADISPLYAVALGYWGFVRSSADHYDPTTSVY
jgi:hypothetical protein